MPENNWYHADAEKGHYHDISWEALEEQEYDYAESCVDVRYPETYC